MDDEFHSQDIINLFLMIVCHQPYSEIKNIPMEDAARWVKKAAAFVNKMFKSEPKKESVKKGNVVPKVPEVFEQARLKRLEEHGLL